jgi:hypothetical protein
VTRHWSSPPEAILRTAQDQAARLSSYIVTKLYEASFIGLDLRKVEGDVAIEPIEEWYPFSNQDRQDRIEKFIR